MPTKKTFVPSRSQKKKPTRAGVNRQATQWWQKETRKLSSAQLCDRCGAVWFDGHWHTAPDLAAALKAKRASAAKTGKAPKPVLCYECHLAAGGPPMAKGGFEGQLTLDGLAARPDKAEIMATVRNFAKRATKRDPEDRIINIDDRGDRVVVTTTENQMAVGLGKAVAAAHKGGTLKIAWSDGDMPARVFWVHKAS